MSKGCLIDDKTRDSLIQLHFVLLRGKGLNPVSIGGLHVHALVPIVWGVALRVFFL